MSLATRCTACGTVFRVVQDQLKVSEGWVRCGRCKEVFNAIEGLFDLEREPAPARPARLAQAAPDERLPEPGVMLSAAADALTEVPAAADLPPAPPALDAPDSESFDSQGFADARFNIELALEDERLAAEAALAAEAGPVDDGTPAPAPTAFESPPEQAAEPEPAPAFLQQAESAARWRRPGVRLALGAASLVLALTLAAQAALQFRNLVAAQWPATLPWLGAACDALGCRIEPPRRIEDIAVESSSLTRAAPDSSALRLVVGLRNRGTLALAPPAVELALTDPNGELIARRTLAPGEFRGAGTTLAPASEITLQALLADPGGRVAGYTVEVFYP